MVTLLGGRDHYLGPYGSLESKELYKRLLAECRWEPTHTLGIPPVWVSGVYLGKLTHAAGTLNGRPVRRQLLTVAASDLSGALSASLLIRHPM